MNQERMPQNDIALVERHSLASKSMVSDELQRGLPKLFVIFMNRSIKRGNAMAARHHEKCAGLIRNVLQCDPNAYHRTCRLGIEIPGVRMIDRSGRKIEEHILPRH